MRLCSALLLVLVVVSPVGSQVRTVGAIAGTIVDASGAVVPGASIRLRDEMTNSERETVSNEQGTFQFLDLQAGSYEVRVTLEGFSSSVYSGVAVESARTTDLTVRLEVGDIGEDVVVTGAAPTLETTSSTLSTTVTNADLQNLPLSGRNVLNFALLVPGVQSGSAASGRQSTYQGTPGATINITIDGINNNSQGFKSGGTSFFATVPPRLDAIEEVSVSTGGLGADTGAEGAMNIRFVTRRGTNAFRGGTFFQYRHESLNANDYFNNARDVEKPRDRRNEFGGHLGGPLVRDKAFFFVNWEEARVPGQQIQTRTVLTEEARQGVYRYQGTDGVERTVNLLDIARASGFASTVDPIIDSQLATISGTAENGALTSTDLLRNELRWNESRTTIEHYPTVRVDYHLTPSLAVNGSLNLFDRDIDGRRQFPGDLTPLQVFGNTWLIGSTSMNWTISPTTLMEIRYGLQRNSDTFNRGELIDQFDIGGRLMRLDYPLGLTELVPNELQIDRNNALHQIYNTLTLVRGNHTFTLGGSFRWIRWFDAGFQGGGVPEYDFGVAAGDPAGNIFNASTLPFISQENLGAAGELYALLTGRVSAISASRGVDPGSLQYLDASQLVREDRRRDGGLWIQDSWRVTPRLTLNYGLRWQASGAIYNGTGVYTNPTPAGLLGPSTTPFAPGQIDGSTDPVIELRPRTYDTDWNNFAPNFGVAWNPSLAEETLLGRLAGGDKTVFRGGYSLSYFDEGLNPFINYAGANPGLTQSLNLNPGMPGFTPGGLSLSSELPALAGFLPASRRRSARRTLPSETKTCRRRRRRSTRRTCTVGTLASSGRLPPTRSSRPVISATTPRVGGGTI